MKFNRQSKSDSYFWHIVDSWGKAIEEQSADPAICYFVYLITTHSWYPDRTGRSPAAASGRGRSLIKPNEEMNSDNSCSFFFLRSFFISAISLHNQSKSLQYRCLLQKGRNIFTCLSYWRNHLGFPPNWRWHGKTNCWKGLWKSRNLDLWGNCKRKHPRFS